jgi:hypothetical protein
MQLATLLNIPLLTGIQSELALLLMIDCLDESIFPKLAKHRHYFTLSNQERAKVLALDDRGEVSVWGGNFDGANWELGSQTTVTGTYQ